MTGGRVVVLGPTGDNFGAGMSGGAAYVHDPLERLPGNTNHELVDLEPVGDADAEELRELIAEHHERTGSEPARRILEDWDSEVADFIRVMSRRYKEVLAERALEKAAA